MFRRPEKKIYKFLYKCIFTTTAAVCAGSMLLSSSLAASADEDLEARLEAQRAMPIQSNEVENWPVGPVVGADSAILMEAETGAILYAKNIHKTEYPASTTKIMTTLLATELCEMDEIVSFSHDAVFDNPPGSSGIAMDVGQALTMEQCLNAILIRSANEVAFAVAEHISGTTDWTVFADTMNKRAAELGALNTHFTNPNGLPDENHYTTAYDLAMIGKAFFENEMLCQISLTRRMEIPASDRLPNAKLELNSMQIIPTGTYAYPYIIGCKTGYTSVSRACLVSCAEKDGLRLICVVLRDEPPYQYTDTIALFDYGFSNFQKINISQTETKYNLDNMGLFYSGNDILGNSRPFLSLDREDYIVLPRTTSFENLDSYISYDTDSSEQAASINYTYHGMDVGSVGVNFAKSGNETHLFGMVIDTSDDLQNSEEPSVIFIDVTKILVFLAVVAVAVFIGLLLHSALKNYAFGCIRHTRRYENDRQRGRRNRSGSKFKDYDL